MKFLFLAGFFFVSCSSDLKYTVSDKVSNATYNAVVGVWSTCDSNKEKTIELSADKSFSIVSKTFETVDCSGESSSSSEVTGKYKMKVVQEEGQQSFYKQIMLSTNSSVEKMSLKVSDEELILKSVEDAKSLDLLSTDSSLTLKKQ